MKAKFVLTLILLLLPASLSAQIFEGKIVYENRYESRIPNVSNEQLGSVLGTRQDYFVKGGNYSFAMNGSSLEWAVYVSAQNRLYTKFNDGEVVEWTDAGKNPSAVRTIQINKGVEDILGYKCDEAIITTTEGVEKYYFSSKLGVDPSVYSRHKYGNWYEITKAIRSLPLKMIVEKKEFVITSVATEITRMKLDPKIFRLPRNLKAVRSPE